MNGAMKKQSNKFLNPVMCSPWSVKPPVGYCESNKSGSRRIIFKSSSVSNAAKVSVIFRFMR